MENLSEKALPSNQVLIAFPKSSEDHRLQLVAINGAIFAIVHSPLESLGPIRLYCEEWSLILLAPLKSRSNIVVSAINVICLSEIVSENGNVNVHASNRLVKFPDLFKPIGKVSEMGERGEFEFANDPKILLHYYRLFEGVVDGVLSGSSELLSEAQQKFITVLCSLAGEIDGRSEKLDLIQTLSIWKIPRLIQKDSQQD